MEKIEPDTPANVPAVFESAVGAVDRIAPSGWRLKLAKATAQLLVGTRKGAAVYAVAREHLDEIEGRSEMNKQLFAVATQQLINDPEMIERAKARLVGDIVQKQENLEAVIKGAGDRVLALPAPVETSSSQSDGDSGDNLTASDDSVVNPLGEDWAATFTGVAERATSEELRDRLSRVLAGELAAPGTYSRSIVRAIAELERTDVEALLSIAPKIMVGLVTEIDQISPDIVAQLGDSALIDGNDIMNSTKTVSATPGNPGGLIDHSYAVILTVEKDRNISISGRLLTKAGRAVLSILDSYDEKQALVDFCSALDKDGIIDIVVGKYEYISAGQIRIRNGEVLYQKTSVITMPKFDGPSPFVVVNNAEI